MAKNKYIKNLHKDASPSTHRHARNLRQTESEAEKKLWSLIRNRKLEGKKFRRQHALAGFVLDFYCHECRLAVELDGAGHKLPGNRQHDRERTQILNDFGITVIRFWNREVIDDHIMVLQRISNLIRTSVNSDLK